MGIQPWSNRPGATLENRFFGWRVLHALLVEGVDMAHLRRIAKAAVPSALEKALRYRLLNEPFEAESICRDVLIVEPDNQDALTTLLLALTDQFDKEFAVALERAKEVVPQFAGEYEREYFSGIIHERWAKAQMVRGMPGSFAYSWLREAMDHYEKAAAISRPDDADADLRWNTCARMLDRRDDLQPQSANVHHDVEASFGDDVPLR